jgi:hypothetical protein
VAVTVGERVAVGVWVGGWALKREMRGAIHNP